MGSGSPALRFTGTGGLESVRPEDDLADERLAAAMAAPKKLEDRVSGILKRCAGPGAVRVGILVDCLWDRGLVCWAVRLGCGLLACLEPPPAATSFGVLNSVCG